MMIHASTVYSCLLFYLFVLGASGGDKRSLAELINEQEPAWKLVKELQGQATNTVTILDKDQQKAREALYQDNSVTNGGHCL